MYMQVGYRQNIDKHVGIASGSLTFEIWKNTAVIVNLRVVFKWIF